MHAKKQLFFLCGTLLVVQAAALYGRKSAVQVLDAKSFDKVIMQQDMAAIVEFFAPWCVQSFSPAHSGLDQMQEPLPCSEGFERIICDIHLLVFFSSRCGHCKSLAPTYLKVAQHLQVFS